MGAGKAPRWGPTMHARKGAPYAQETRVHTLEGERSCETRNFSGLGRLEKRHMGAGRFQLYYTARRAHDRHAKRHGEGVRRWNGMC